MIKYMIKCCALTLCILLTATLAQAAQRQAPQGPLVLVLPYQVNTSGDMQSLQKDLPALLTEKIIARGMRVVPAKQARDLLQARNVETLDLEQARKLGAAVKAQIVVYGTLNQLGDGFAMDSRVVPMTAGTKAQAVSLQKGNMMGLGIAAEELATAVAGHVAPAAPSVAAASLPVGMSPGKAPAGGLGDVLVRGMKVMDPDVVLMRLSIRKGDSPDAAAINEEVKRIWDMGYFSDVRASFEPGNILVFTVVEKPRIDNIVVDGSGKVGS